MTKQPSAATEARQFLRRNTKPSLMSGKPWRWGEVHAHQAGAFSPSQNIWQFPDGSRVEYHFGLVRELRHSHSAR